MKTLDLLATLLLVIGGLNWGLVGLANVDLVALASGAGHFGVKNPFGAVVYALVGIAAVYQVIGWKAIRARWARSAA
jgi:hypothetical protein